jgi:hypothetical protein
MGEHDDEERLGIDDQYAGPAECDLLRSGHTRTGNDDHGVDSI